jgi:hypothetical protein
MTASDVPARSGLNGSEPAGERFSVIVRRDVGLLDVPIEVLEAGHWHNLLGDFS